LIRVLPEEEIRKIAAGEVIERPASVVKELIENSLDAGALEVAVEIEGAGERLIRVADSGCGMSREDALLALERHATSKIVRAQDIESLSTFGFRGEALPSIGAVAEVELLTRGEGEEVATLIRIEGGKSMGVSGAGRERGTTLTVRNLFFNTPARRKFLKSAQTELRHILQEVSDQALAHPETAFRLAVDGEETLVLPAAKDVRERLIQVQGKSFVDKLAEARYTESGVVITGFTSRPDSLRSSRSHQTLFLNRRRIASRMVSHAVYQGYGSSMGQKHPAYFLFLRLDPGVFDVNVHPTKREVRFHDEGAVHHAVVRAVEGALVAFGEASAPPMDRGRPPAERMPEPPGPHGFSPDMMKAFAPLLPRDQTSFMGELVPPGAGGVAEPPSAYEAVPGEAPGPLPGPKALPVVLWQLHKTYLFASIREGLLIIDQHVAHERILYEEVLRRTGRPPSQQLLFHHILDLSPLEHALYKEYSAHLEELGFSVKEFSGRTIVVEAVPASLRTIEEGEIVREILSELHSQGRGAEDRLHAVAKAYACRGAIKAGEELTQEEMNRLVDELFACETPHLCPHGRPVFVRIALGELHRRFGRA
jgi:DNA mismatch repair protein MutL